MLCKFKMSFYLFNFYDISTQLYFIILIIVNHVIFSCTLIKQYYSYNIIIYNDFGFKLNTNTRLVSLIRVAIRLFRLFALTKRTKDTGHGGAVHRFYLYSVSKLDLGLI